MYRYFHKSCDYVMLIRFSISDRSRAFTSIEFMVFLFRFDILDFSLFIICIFMGYSIAANLTIAYLSFVVLVLSILLLVECKSKDLLVSIFLIVGIGIGVTDSL